MSAEEMIRNAKFAAVSRNLRKKNRNKLVEWWRLETGEEFQFLKTCQFHSLGYLARGVEEKELIPFIKEIDLLRYQLLWWNLFLLRNQFLLSNFDV